MSPRPRITSKLTQVRNAVLGMLLVSLDIPPAEAVGRFLENYAWVIGILAGLWYFFRGGFSLP